MHSVVMNCRMSSSTYAFICVVCVCDELLDVPDCICNQQPGICDEMWNVLDYLYIQPSGILLCDEL
jgi:hypothetical protein